MRRGQGRQPGSGAQPGRRERGARATRDPERQAGSRGGLEPSGEEGSDDELEEPRRRRPEDRFGEGQFGDGQDWQQPRFLAGSEDQGARADHGPAEQEAAWIAGGASEAQRRGAGPDEHTGSHAGKDSKNRGSGRRRSKERCRDDAPR